MHQFIGQAVAEGEHLRAAVAKHGLAMAVAVFEALLPQVVGEQQKRHLVGQALAECVWLRGGIGNWSCAG
ncbi:hypothetical protein GCM10022409_48610 [Hymenobacter glaciei]|uniref:Uncharacterized protein n=1 Tax=Hymenobacter glaciei TaxID=877209 RepID=A0ABP7UYN9_9BACT